MSAEQVVWSVDTTMTVHVASGAETLCGLSWGIDAGEPRAADGRLVCNAVHYPVEPGPVCRACEKAGSSLGR